MLTHRNIGTPALLCALAAAAACGTSQATEPPPGSESTEAQGVATPDASFAALQERGAQAMGVDQYTSTHVFDALPDGGRIELQRDVDDPDGVATIRSHLAGIADAFGAGDFSMPAFVHMGAVPGTDVMATRKDRIDYIYRELPRGAELRMVTTDADAIRAIHEFMGFQREQHRARGTGDHAQHHQLHQAMPRSGGMQHDSAQHAAHHAAHHGGGGTPNR